MRPCLHRTKHILANVSTACLRADPVLAYDMRAFHLRSVQLKRAGRLKQLGKFRPSGPDAIAMSSLYLYKAFAGGGGAGNRSLATIATTLNLPASE